MTRVGSAVYVIIGKWQQQHRNKEQHDKKTDLHPNNKVHTPIHPGYRVTSPKHGNSHECHMTTKIGLSKTQSQESWSRKEIVC